VLLRAGVPKEFQEQKGSTYETRYIYTGFSRYDTEKKTIGRFVEKPNGRLMYYELPCTDTVFSRAYHTELVRVTVYSEKPRIWKEEVSPHEVYFFQQQD
jgi:hypothetical protein